MSESVFDIAQIQKILPHRFPLLLVDRITHLEPKVSIEGYKNVTINEPVFQGHFPSLAVYPGVYTLEGMAQISTILMFKSFDVPDNSLVYFASIDNAKFRKSVVPGDKLEYKVKLVKARAKFGVTQAEAFVDGDLVAQAVLKAAIG